MPDHTPPGKFDTDRYSIHIGGGYVRPRVYGSVLGFAALLIIMWSLSVLSWIPDGFAMALRDLLSHAGISLEIDEVGGFGPTAVSWLFWGAMLGAAAYVVQAVLWFLFPALRKFWQRYWVVVAIVLGLRGIYHVAQFAA